MDSTQQAKTIIIYRELSGNEPFTEWLNRLRDPVTRRRILQRLLRVESGQYGDFKAIGNGVNEFRFFWGQTIASILVKMETSLWFCSAAATRTAKAVIFSKPNVIGRST